MITSTRPIGVARDTAPGTGSTSGTSNTSNASGTASDGSGAITAAAGGAMGETQFVQLLVTEMKNQDPLNPMDGKDLAVQLAQFSSVEQLMNVNTKLDNLTSAVKAQGGVVGSGATGSSGSNSSSSSSSSSSTSTAGTDSSSSVAG